jgi:hypothetical protein
MHIFDGSYHKLELKRPREIPVEGPLSCNPQSIERQMVGTLVEASTWVRTSDHTAHSTRFWVSPYMSLPPTSTASLRIEDNSCRPK